MTEREEASPAHYLHRCLDLHPKVTEIRYGRTYDLRRIEGEVGVIRSSRQLTYDDIERIRNSDVWNADVFGYWPARSEVESILKSTEWDFWNLPKKEEKAIESLFSLFRQIEPVSVILRFIAPEHYGILSPPVETVLGLGPFRSHPDRYRAYLKNLRKIRDAGQFKTAADVDMALWVLQLGVLEGLLSRCLPNEEHRCLKEKFRRDTKLREIRAINLTRQLFSSDVSRAELAEALSGGDEQSDVELAGQIAGIEFERLARQLVGARPNERLMDLVRCNLPALVDPDLHLRCINAVRIRNRAVHSALDLLRREEVARLIRVVRELGRMEERRKRKADE